MLNNPVNSGAGTAGTTGSDKVATSAPASETQQMFTKLLVAQIQNQDPLSPTDPSQFVNQLSQLSQTEAMQSLAQTQSASASVLQSLQVLAMGAQVGSSVSVATGSVRIGEDKVSGNVQLSAASAGTSLVLTGADGAQHTVALPAHGPGALAFTIDPQALGLAPGTYRVQAVSSDGTKPAVEIEGSINSVRMSSSGGVVLQVANVGEVDPAAITSFNGKANAS
jgi:flagellar basal-body rod modification protein FlgD